MSGGESSPFLSDELSKHTVIFGLRMWVLVGVGVGAAFVVLLLFISLWLAFHRRPQAPRAAAAIPDVSKEIQEIRVDNLLTADTMELGQILKKPLPEPEPPLRFESQVLLSHQGEENTVAQRRIHTESAKDHIITCLDREGSGGGRRPSSDGSHKSLSAEQASLPAPDVWHLGWGHWYTLRELEVATNMFASENVIGEGGYGIVYHGVLKDGTQVAVKNLLDSRGQAEREFKVEVEAIGRVRHKNLVRLLGFCVEGVRRILVYEYVDNGNLEQWLHGDVGNCIKPLTWDIRMNIILGTAKGLMYLHEAIEPKVVHRDIKSSNILLDQQWNPKVSDFGLAKILDSERSFVNTRVMGTFGYVAPEYASTGMLNERSDIYSFGILILEIISGRSPVDYSRPAGEVNLVEWLKTMVTNRNFESVLDPKLPEKPSSRAMKKILLVALRCVDPEYHKRPKMGHVIHMLEADDFPYRDDRRAGRAYRNNAPERTNLPVGESGDSSGYESNNNASKPSRWRKQET